MKKIKNLYFVETKEEFEEIGGHYSTGLVIELKDGRLFRQQSTDVIMSFEPISPKKKRKGK